LKVEGRTTALPVATSLIWDEASSSLDFVLHIALANLVLFRYHDFAK